MRSPTISAGNRQVTSSSGSTTAAASLLVLALLAGPASAQSHRIVAFSIAGGGGSATDGTYMLIGTAGQPIAGTTAAGGGHRLTAGFWAVASRSAPTADLTLTKSDDTTTAIPGQTLTYTLVVANSGPASVIGARVVDSLPAALAGATWSCDPSPGASCTEAGVGPLDESVDLAAGASVTFRLTATVDATATGNLVNTASVSPPDGVVDPDPTNDAATDSDTLLPTADLQITKQDGRTETEPSAALTYTIEASNAGPSHAPEVLVSDVLPAELSACTWICNATGGAACGAPSSGDLNDTASLPPGAKVVYTGSCLVAPSAGPLLENTATISAPPGVSDPVPANNAATDSTAVVPDLWLFTDGFESGDLGAWSSITPQALLMADAETPDRYLERLSMIPALLRQISRNEEGEEILAGLDPDGRRVFSVRLRRRDGSLELGVGVRAAEEPLADLGWRPIHRHPRELEVEWRRSLPGLDDGLFLLSIDGDLVHWSADLSNHRQRLDRIGTAQDRGRALLQCPPGRSDRATGSRLQQEAAGEREIRRH